MALVPVKSLTDWFLYDSDRVKIVDGTPYIETENDSEQKTRLVKKGVQVGLNDIPSAARKLIEPLLEKGWNISINQSETFRSGGFYGPKTQKAGQKRADKSTTWTWAHGERYGRRFRASWEDSKPSSFALADGNGVKHVERVGDFVEWINAPSV